ncbi:MAG TPA: hypothetical protein VFM35_09320 [Candidatus Binatia bacterium]|nr:hypothetical protein [Candidatus Binatia bacterium]
MTNRLGRIIDRARVLERSMEDVSPELLSGLRSELGTLVAPRKADQ